ncbi:MAG: hypothetical protein ACPHWZ_09630 [Longimicrobiales bacterium]
MSDDQETTKGTGQESSHSGGEHRRKSMGDGIKEGLGVLSAFRDALEETIQEARERGDLSTDRAREVMKETLGRAQIAAEEARGRLDFASQADLEKVKDAVDAMKVRLGALEESVFGASDDAAAEATGGGDDPGGDGED